jgi:thymidylate synthase
VYKSKSRRNNYSYIEENGDYAWFTIQDVQTEAVEDIKVYNFEVKNDHTYTIQNLMCHNCYGFQWRHFGANYRNMYTDYTGLGFDQIKEIVRQIKEEPDSRRIILSAWNPPHLHDMCLPPCHAFSQFYVDSEEKTLSCQIYIRSNDIGLGCPFNIASYALLTYMLAEICDLSPKDLVYTIGDAHLYLNHIDAIKEQLTRTPRAFPTLEVTKKVRDPADYEMQDFKLEGYKPHKRIKMKMAV